MTILVTGATGTVGRRAHLRAVGLRARRRLPVVR